MHPPHSKSPSRTRRRNERSRQDRARVDTAIDEPIGQGRSQKEVGQQRADDALNAKGNFRFERELRGWRSGLVLDTRCKE